MRTGRLPTGWRVTAALMLALLCAGAGGCGYSTATLLRSDIRSVHVPVFENRTFRRGLEVELTRALVRELTLHTHLRIAPADRADSTLSGELVDFAQETVTKSAQGDILLKRLQATVRFRWRDNLTGRDIVPPQRVVESETVALARAEQPELHLFRKVAQRLVEKMQREW